MGRLLQLYNKLGYTRENGLFLLDDYEVWIHMFPYRISRLIKEVIKPVSFFCIYANSEKKGEHPEPFNKSFVFFFDNPTEQQEEEIHKKIINFGLAQIVFINRAETIDLYHGVNFKEKTLTSIIKGGSITDFLKFSFKNQLNGNVYKTLKVRGKTIDFYLLNNIIDARRILVAKDGLALRSRIANRLIGRLLFVSYLIDRNVQFSDQVIIKGATKEERKEHFRAIIAEKDTLYDFFSYLTNKYDGDMFPLVEEIGGILRHEKDNVTTEHLKVLSYLFNSSEFFSDGDYKGYTVQESLFNLYDFEVIPVELISSIYESFIGNEEENEELEISKQRKVKAYYTPPYIVDYILEQTVSPFLASHRTSECKVLDPSCGSGIFLVEVLRKIIEKELALTGKTSLSDKRLWELVKSNVFGIDIDADAIEITLFSIYITILDYKKPAEIETFKFESLQGQNLFGGREADFFNTMHPFNSIISDLNFVVGNPPWGKVNESRYVDYIKERNVSTKSQKDRVELQIGNKEICQAFLVRASDFKGKHPLKCSFVITSKILYNSDSKVFRNFFLHNYLINQVLELSPINNKIRGGNHVFDSAKYPASIITYSTKGETDIVEDNVFQHITVRPNMFFLYYKTIVISKSDVEYVKQRFLIESLGGDDWLWKTLVYGNSMDYQLIKRLKNDYNTVKEHGFDNINGGLKLVDGDNLHDSNSLNSLKYLNLDIENSFVPFFVKTEQTWEEYSSINNKLKANKGQIGYIPKQEYFKGNRMLFKKGVVLRPQKEEHYFGAVAAYTDEAMCYTSTVATLLPPEGLEDASIYLNELVALCNSKLFTYYVLHTSPSLGIEKSRINFEDFIDFPVRLTGKIGGLAKLLVSHKEDKSRRLAIREAIENEIIKIYKLSDADLSLIDYTMNVSIPGVLREEKAAMFKPLCFYNEADKEFISHYIDVFINHLANRFKRVGKRLKSDVIYSNDFVRIQFTLIDIDLIMEDTITKATTENDSLLVGELGYYKFCKELFIQQDIRGFNSNSFYIIKPNEKKSWHKALAYSDVFGFEGEIVKAEIRRLNRNKE